MARKIIVSTVGTSLLTNESSGDFRKDIISKSNLSKQEGQLDDTLPGILEYVIKPKLKEKFSTNDLPTYQRMSAELNGIIGIYKGHLDNQPDDLHVLIATDTYQGFETASILEDLLKSKGFATMVYTPKNLSTKNKKAFLEGMKDLLRWFEDENGLNIKSYKSNGYEVIFNLTGGFKSLQGYLNVIGMFYADSVNYIFEGNNEMIEIPKLPIRIEQETFFDNATNFALMSQDLPIPKQSLLGISETLLEEIDSDMYLLSAWGELSWNNTKRKVFSKNLIQFPYIAYQDSFKNDFQTTDREDDKTKLQETITKISKILQENNGDISKLKGGQSGGILYDNYTGKKSHIGHFRISDSIRVSCIYENQTLKLRHYGSHDYVNDNP